MARREGINPDAVYSREEVARLLGVSLSTVKRLISS
ncbi:MAG: DNA-binding protein, partial [Chloroflexus aggregans]